MRTIQRFSLFLELEKEIERANTKHGKNRLAIPVEVIAILVEELGEYAEAVMKGKKKKARKELLQLCGVALNHLRGTGPHWSSK